MLDKLKKRHAVKLFDKDRKIDMDQFHTLVSSANLTPTSLGIQPVRIVTIASDEFKEKLTTATYNQPQIKSCSHLFVFAIKKEILPEYIDEYIKLVSITRMQSETMLAGFKNMILGWMNRLSPEDYKLWAKNQAYLTLGNFLTVCANEDIDSCPIEGFDPKQYDEILNLEADGLTSVIICAVGYKSIDDPRAKEEKVRLPNYKYHIRQY